MRRLLLFRPADGSKKRPVVEEEGGEAAEIGERTLESVPSPREPIKGSFDAF